MHTIDDASDPPHDFSVRTECEEQLHPSMLKEWVFARVQNLKLIHAQRGYPEWVAPVQVVRELNKTSQVPPRFDRANHT